MKKLKDKAFFENINEFLCNYLPRIRAKSSLTIMSYKTTLNLLLTFLCSTYTIDIFTVETTMLTSENIVRFFGVVGIQPLQFSRHNQHPIVVYPTFIRTSQSSGKPQPHSRFCRRYPIFESVPPQESTT